MLKKLSVLALSAALAFGATSAGAEENKSPYWQCVTFARSITGMNIFGDAWTWWEKASGKYEKGTAPKPGAVLVFRPQGKMRLGHVAVVSQVVTDRVIQITHANWSPIGGRRGQVEKDVTVVDVSDKGDWSKVKVWYGPIADVGTTVYPTYGFIYQAAQKGQEMGQSLVAQVLDKPTVKKPGLDTKAAMKTSAKAGNAKALTAALSADGDAPKSQALASDAPEAAVAALHAADAKPSVDKAAPVKTAAKSKTEVAKAETAKGSKSKSAKATAEADEAPAKSSKASAKASGKTVKAKTTTASAAKPEKTAKKLVADADEAPAKAKTDAKTKAPAKKVAETEAKKAPVSAKKADAKA